MTFQVFN